MSDQTTNDHDQDAPTDQSGTVEAISDPLIASMTMLVNGFIAKCHSLEEALNEAEAEPEYPPDVPHFETGGAPWAT
ncbi:MAG: hypothetical protein AAGC55_16345 [Myxococcota bacterium]